MSAPSEDVAAKVLRLSWEKYRTDPVQRAATDAFAAENGMTPPDAIAHLAGIVTEAMAAGNVTVDGIFTFGAKRMGEDPATFRKGAQTWLDRHTARRPRRRRR